MKKIIILIIALLLLIQFSFALDENIILKKCDFAFSNLEINPFSQTNEYLSKESAIFKTWDGQRGIFVTITNTNAVLGKTPNYVVTYKSPERDYYFNGELKGKTILPTANDPKSLYTKCYFLTGDNPIVTGSSMHAQWAYLTQDFGINPSSTGTLGVCTGYPCSKSTSLLYLEEYMKTDKYWDKSTSAYLGSGAYRLMANSDTSVVLYRKLSNLPTGIHVLRSILARSVGDGYLITNPPDISFYLIAKPSADFMTPAYTSKISITDTTDGNTLMGTYHMNMVLKPETKYTVNVTFKNPFEGYTLDQMPVQISVSDYVSQTAGCGVYIDGRSDVKVMKTQSFNFILDKMEPLQQKNVSFNFSTDKGTMCKVILSIYSKTKDGTIARRTWPRVGGEEEKYLAFSSVWQNISIIENVPYFVGATDLSVPNSSNNLPIEPDDYTIITRIRHTPASGGPPLIKYQKETLLDAEKISELTGGSSTLSKGFLYRFKDQVEITENMPEGNYSMDFFTKSNTGRFEGKTVAYMPPLAKFEVGGLQYPGTGADGKIFILTNSSRTAVKEIAIFNPDFRRRNIKLRIIDENKIDFTFNYQKDFLLKPLELRKVNITVRSKIPVSDGWYITTDVTKTFSIEAVSDQPGNPSTAIEYTIKSTALKCGTDFRIGKNMSFEDKDYCCGGLSSSPKAFLITDMKTNYEGKNTQDSCFDGIDNDCDEAIDCLETECNPDAAKKITDPDKSYCYCELSKPGIQGTCTLDETGCWFTGSLASGCCGNTAGETWSSYEIESTETSSAFDQIQNIGTCVNSKWVQNPKFKLKVTS